MPQEYVARWAGGRIGVGASVFHFQSIAGGSAAQGCANAVRTLFAAFASALPDDVLITFDPEVRDLANDGTLTAVYPVTPPSSVAGASTASFLNGSGALIRHSTASIVNGRRLLGRTFLVPYAPGSFGTNGDLSSTSQATLNTAFATFKTQAASAGANFAVWSRANSLVADVTASNAVARPTTLRTRNDRL